MKPIKSNILKSPTDRNILFVVIATGIASVVTQLLFIRELLAQFQGNEMVIALVLFNWLILGGMGTRLAARVRSANTDMLVRLSFVLVVLGAVQMVAIRWLRPLLFGVGVSAGFYPIALFSLFTVAPYALLVGYVLPYSLYVLRIRHPAYPGTRIYLADNLGDICGGVFFTFVLVVWSTPMQALVLGHVPIMVTAFRLATRRLLRFAGAGAALTALIIAVCLESPLLTPAVGRLVHYEESRFARLTVHRNNEQVTIFADGRPIASTGDTALAELTVHYPLSQVDHLRRVLMISACGGMIPEIEKYQPDIIDYVELDPAVARLMAQYGLVADAPGLNRITTDGRLWLSEQGRAYDAILLTLPEPDTFQLNRFFTDHFFALVRQHMSSHGVFSFSVQGAANMLTAAQRRKISSLYATARRHFDHVQLLPGERIYFLCRTIPITVDIAKRLTAKKVTTRFVDAYFYGDVTPERIESLRAALDINARINRDTKPYLMQLVMSQWFLKYGASPHLFIGVLTVLLVLYLIRIRRVEYVLFSTGVLAMGCEVVLIFAFQIFLGYIYAKIGMLVTVFLAGLLPGAWLGSRPNQPAGFLFVSDMAIIAMMLAVVALFHWQGDRLPALFYYTSGFCIATACGFQIPLALAFLGDDNPAVAHIFSADLVGAAFGAIMTSTIFIPYLGLGGSIAVLIAVKLISLLFMGERYAAHRSTHLSLR